MSGPEKPGPLTPADIRAIRELVKARRAGGWRFLVLRDEKGEVFWRAWTRRDLLAQVSVTRGSVMVVAPERQSWNVPATVLDALYALTRAGLIPGQVSVTQPDDDTQTCSRCGDSVHYLSSAGLCDGCEAEPRVWNHGDDGEPGPEVRAVFDRSGDEWTRTGDGWAFRNERFSLTWDAVLAHWGPLTEAVDR